MIAPAKRVLLIENNEANYLMLRDLLAEIVAEQFEIEWVQSVEAARQALNFGCYDIGLVSYQSVGRAGLNFIAEHAAGDPPFIVLTEADDHEVDIAATKAGAMDYLLKSHVNTPILERSIRYAIERAHRENALQKALHQSLLLATVVGNLTDGMIVVDAQAPDHPIVFINAAFSAMTGYSSEEVLGRNCRFLQGPDTDPETVQQIRAAIGEQRPFSGTILNYRKDGTPFWNGLKITPVCDGEGNLINFVGLETDMTARRQAEIALQESQARKTAILEAALDGILTINNRNIIVEFNPAAEKIFGYSHAQAVGRSADELIVLPRTNEEQRTLTALLAKPSSDFLDRQIELVGLHSDGTAFPAELAFTRVLDGGEWFFTGYIRNISARKQADEKLRQSEANLRAAQQIAHLGSWELDLTKTRDYSKNPLRWSDEIFRIFGYQPGEIEISHEAFLRCVHPDDRTRVLATMETALRENRPYLIDHRIVWPDGTERVLHSQAEILRDESGVALKMIGIGQDITERKQQETALLRANDELEARVARRTLEVKQSEKQALSRALQHEAVAELGKQALSDIDLRELLQSAASLVAATLHVELCSFWELLPRSNLLRRRATVGLPEARMTGIDMKVGNGSQIGYCAWVGEVVIVEDLAHETRFPIWSALHELKIASVATVPVEDGSLYGVLAAASTQKQKFSQNDRYFLQAIANVLASAIARKHAEMEILQLNTDLRCANEELRSNEVRLLRGNQTFADLTRLRATADDELQVALHQITEAGSQMLDVERCSVWTFNSEGTVLRCLDAYERSANRHSQGWELDEDEHYFPTIKTLRIVVADDVLTNPLISHSFEHYLRPSGIVSLLDVALVVGGQPIGVLCCEHIGEPRKWQTEDQTFANSVASACALVLESHQRAAAESASRHARNEAEQARQEAEFANQAKSEFLSRMSHELRTPLNAILGFGQILDRQELPALQKENIGYILKGGRHLLHLINEVLNIARVETGHLELSIEPVALEEVASECCALVRPSAQEREIRIVNSWAQNDNYHVMADRQRLKQVLLNLLSNAIKYNRPAGEVVISTAQVGDRIQLRVHDTGPGLAPTDLKKLFTPFERLSAADSKIEGTGLGLVLSQRIVIAMGGTLGVSSQLGEGTTFWVELPRAESTLDAVKKLMVNAAPQAPSTGERTYTVLSIEDNLSNIRLLEAILESRPEITLLAAMQGSLGLDLARQHQPDVILLDLNLPGISGGEVLERLQASQSTKDIPVIVISADAIPSQIERLLAAGAVAYLTKPIDVNEFFEQLDKVLHAKKSAISIAR